MERNQCEDPHSLECHALKWYYYSATADVLISFVLAALTAIYLVYQYIRTKSIPPKSVIIQIIFILVSDILYSYVDIWRLVNEKYSHEKDDIGNTRWIFYQVAFCMYWL